MQPRYIFQIDNLEVTGNGKADLKQLPLCEENNTCPKEVYNNNAEEETMTECEKKLKDIWRKVLGIDSFNIYDDFFEIGGYSIKAVMVAYEINKQFNMEIQLSELFIRATIKELAEYIMKMQNNEKSVPYVKFNDNLNNKKVFAFPPILSYGMYYKRIAEFMEEYAMYAFDFIEDEDRINAYIESMVEVQEEGPYTIIGYSVGGSLAFQVASKLIERGYKVEKLLILDSKFKDEIIDFSEEAVMKELRKEIKAYSGSTNYDQADSVDCYIQKTKKYSKYFHNLVITHSIDMDIHYLYASDNNDKRFMWQKASTKGIFYYAGQGSHFELFNDENIGANVKIIKKILKDK